MLSEQMNELQSIKTREVQQWNFIDRMRDG